MADLLGLGERLGEGRYRWGEAMDPLAEGADDEAEVAGDLLAGVAFVGDEADSFALEVFGVGDPSSLAS